MGKHFVFLSLLLILPMGCSDTAENSNTQQAAIAEAVFNDSVTQFTLAVFYEIGSDPYTGNAGLVDTWDLANGSFTALFSNHLGRTISVPNTIAAMTSFVDQNQTSWTVTELLTLGQQLTSGISSGTTITIPVIFVSGLYQGSASILGLHITGHPYAFIFKDVITSVGGTATQQRFVEQATVIHEVGHAIGLVNNGVPMVSNHEDPSHLHHTTNSNCVMYWTVESTTDILNQAIHFIGLGSSNLFGSESLADGRNYKP